MADYIQVPPDSTGKKVDAVSMDVGANTVMRQRIVIGDNSATAQFAVVTGGALVCTGTFNISAMPANLGTLNDISRTVQVQIATPFTVNNISATVTVAGVVGLTAGTANIGRINDISATVNVSGIVNISAMPSVVLAAGTANFGTLNDISRTVTVAGNVGLVSGATVIISGTAAVVLATGVNNIGALNHISRTVQVQLSTPFTLDNISRTVQVQVATPFTLNNISASVLVATGATADFNTLASADQVQTLPLFGFALPADGGAVAGGTPTNPISVLVQNASATVSVVLAAGTQNIGTINDISSTVQVAIGTPFTVNNVSATVTVVGSVGLAAGVANIGRINDISATVTIAGIVNVSATASVILAAGTANFGTLNNISATVIVALGAPYTINNISATVAVAGSVGLVAGTVVIISGTAAVTLATGVNNIGALNHISRTVQAQITTPFTLDNISATVTTVVSGFTPAIMSASHGPKCVTCSTSAVVTLITSPGAGASIYVTQLMVGNASGSLTKARIGTSASASTVVQPLAASGGGFVFRFDPPWMLSASEACVCSVKPSVADAYFTVNYFVK